MSLDEQLRLFQKGQLASSDAFYFGETPDNLIDAGLPALPLTFTQYDYKKSTKQKHNVLRRAIKALRSNLENALFAFRQGDEYAFVLPDIDADGKPLLVAIHVNQTMDRSPVNAIKSLYGLDHPGEWIENQIKKGKEFIPLDKKRANTFLQTYGYSASVEGTIVRSEDTVPRETGEVKRQFSLSSMVEETSEEAVSEAVFKYSLVRDRETLAFLDGQKTVRVYRAMQVIDGELYPPMAAKVKDASCKAQLVEPTKIGEWYQADERPDLIDKKGMFTLNKGNGSSITAAYNPYFHTSRSIDHRHLLETIPLTGTKRVTNWYSESLQNKVLFR